MGSISWCGHQVHISVPIHRLLDSGVDSFTLGCSISGLLLHARVDNIFESCVEFNSITGSVFLDQITAHHFYLGIVFVSSRIISDYRDRTLTTNRLTSVTSNWHAQLSINLAVTGALSITFAHHIYSIPIYPYCASDYPTTLCLFYHHVWISGFLIVGAGAHSSISFIVMLRSYSLFNFVYHRDVIIGHLIWVSIALGLHSFSLYIHNDSLEALGRAEDTFNDNSIQLKPVLAIKTQTRFVPYSFDIKVQAFIGKVQNITQELGTADFIVHHIHAFTIHTALLILGRNTLRG